MEFVLFSLCNNESKEQHELLALLWHLIFISTNKHWNVNFDQTPMGQILKHYLVFSVEKPVQNMVQILKYLTV